MIQGRLAKLRQAMKENNIHCYIIPTCDYHNSEYVSEYFCVRKYFSGFTGSAGTLVVFEDKAALFTDGRYFIQAATQLVGSNITLMKMGEPGVPKLKEYVEDELKEDCNIGFDGRVMTAEEGTVYEAVAKRKNGKVICNLDLAEKIWADRPSLPASKVFILEEIYSGESVKDKLARVRDKMSEHETNIHVLTTLDDIAWLFNLRADDVECCPLLLAYAIITKEEAYLFANEGAFGEEERKYLTDNNVTLKSYDSFYDYIAEMSHNKENTRILLCDKRINYRLKMEMGESVTVVDMPNPTTLMKSIKNPVEQENIRKAHLMDALAVTRFMYWLKTNAGKIPMTEISVAEYLEEFRKESSSYIEASFHTICGYGANGAIIHYSAVEGECADIKAEGMLLIDSGGHYYEGSTDITRTFVLGDITDEMREDYTLVARAMLRLKNIKFLHGCRGENLDLSAREVFWEKGMDYKHGTGHGVGYVLNVHEGPNVFNYKASANKSGSCVLEEGMVTTDEPGMYKEGSHGIRLENELLCRKGEKNEYGQFMYFEDLTYVPLDLDGIDTSLMENKEITMLNDYHRMVYEKLSPYFDGDELEWLKKVTREV